MMGSVAYGVEGSSSDVDLYGIAIPPKEMIFPHLAGHILGFGTQHKSFDQYQQAHIQDPDSDKEYDFQIYSIVKFFHLAMQNNPNIIDSIFTPQFCVVHTTNIGNIIRDHRRDFLHKGCWPKFKGYAYSQLHKMKNKNPEGKRKATVEKYGFDVKFGYHVARLLDEVEQILTLGDIDLQRNREQMKAIRRGDVPLDDLIKWASDKELQLEKVHSESKLPEKPDEAHIKSILLNCLEEHYGSLDNCLNEPDAAVALLRKIEGILDDSKRVIWPERNDS